MPVYIGEIDDAVFINKALLEIFPITFRKAGLDDLVFRYGRALPLHSEYIFNQELYTGEDNQVKVIDFGGDAARQTLYQVNFLAMAIDQDIKKIKSWFKSAQINGAEGSFTMINEDGEGKTVRLWSDKLSMTIDDSGLYSAFLVLRGE